MLGKIARRVVLMRRQMILIFAVLTVVSACLIGKTVINYDFTDYLSADTVTRKSLDMMEKDFGNTDQLTIMFENLDDGVCGAVASDLHAREGVLRAMHNPESDTRIMDGVKYERIEVFLECEDSVQFVLDLMEEFDARADIGKFHLSGPAPQTIKLKENIMREVVIAMAIASAVVLAVLLLTSHSWFDPVIFIIVLIVSIVINMGTNWIFPSISFVTFAVCAILQLALAMDYSIMLLHDYCDILKESKDRAEAMERALKRVFMPVSSSALTTIAGLVSLMFMSFTVGFDIGIVLSKGILISMLTVFFLMPALILAFSRELERFSHKPVRLGGGKIGAFAYAARKILPVVLIAVIVVSCAFQGKNEYVFTDDSSNIESNIVSRVFGLSNQLVLLFPADMSDEALDTQRQMIDKLMSVSYQGRPAVTSVTSLVTTGEAAVKYYTLKEISQLSGISEIALGMYTGSMGFGTCVRGDALVDKAAEIMTENKMIQTLKETLDFARSMFVGKTYSRMILLMDIPYFGDEMFRVLDEITQILKDTYPGEEVGVAGATMSSYDISSAFESDMLIVNLISIAAVVLIIFLSFRKIVIPVILVCVIQGAIWVTLSFSTLIGEKIFFMCYLIITAIMMGATIDYAILLSRNYVRSRREKMPREAIIDAMEASLPTIFTSGVILALSGFIIGNVCSVYYIYSIGQMLSRGAVISMLLVVLLLPAMLVNLDKMVAPKDRFREGSDNG